MGWGEEFCEESKLATRTQQACPIAANWGLEFASALFTSFT